MRPGRNQVTFNCWRSFGWLFSQKTLEDVPVLGLIRQLWPSHLQILGIVPRNVGEHYNSTHNNAWVDSMHWVYTVQRVQYSNLKHLVTRTAAITSPSIQLDSRIIANAKVLRRSITIASRALKLKLWWITNHRAFAIPFGQSNPQGGNNYVMESAKEREGE